MGVTDAADRAILASRRTRRLVAALTILLFVAFAAQEVVIARYKEPYPGLVLPSFAGEIEPDVILKRVASLEVEFTDGSTARIGNGRFSGGTTGRPIDLLNSLFWVNVEEIGPRLFAPADQSSIDYTATRLAEIFPGREIERLVVIWTQRAVNLDGTDNAERTTVVRTVHVDL